MASWREAYQEFGRAYWTDLVTRFESNVSAIARASGICRSSVYPILRRYGVTLAERPNPFARRGRWLDP